MTRQLMLLGLVACAGLACGTGLRLVGLEPVPEPAPAVEVTIAVDPGAAVTGPSPSRPILDTGPVPTVEELAAARGAGQRGLLMRYLAAANLDDLKALALSPWAETADFARLTGLIDLRAVEVDPAGWYAWLGEKLDGYEGRQRQQVFFTSWMRIDPEAAFLAGEELDRWVRAQALDELAKTDRGRALELLRLKLPASTDIRPFEKERLKELAETDREGALEEALGLQLAGRGSAALSSLLKTWAEAEPEAAWAWLEVRGEFLGRSAAAASVIEGMARVDPELARKYLATLPNNIGRRKLEGAILAKQAQTDPQGALARILAEPDPAQRGHLFGVISAHLELSDPGGMLRQMVGAGVVVGQGRIADFAMKSHSGGVSTRGGVDAGGLVRRAAMELAKEDPAQALGYLLVLDRGAIDTRSEITSQWVKRDAASAASWAWGLAEDSRIAIDLRNNILGSWASESPADAAAFLVEQGIDDSQTAQAWRLVEQWMKTDPEAALQWSKNEAPATLPGALGVIAKTEPDRAAAQLDLLNDARDRRRGIQQVAEAWTRSDPRASFEWLGSLPEVDDVGVELGQSAGSWVRREPQEASAFIREMPDGERRDSAVAGMLEQLIHTSSGVRDFEAASAWIGELSDEGMREHWKFLLGIQKGVEQ